MKRWLIGMLYLAVLNSLLLMTAACGTSQPTTVVPEVTPEPDDQLVIYFFQGNDFGPINLATDNTAATLRQIDLAKSQYQLSDKDIVSYDWPTQVITLNPALREKYRDKSQNFLGIDAFFVLFFKGEPFFGGVIWNVMSPVSIKFPVLYVLDGRPYHQSDDFSIALRPQHGVALPPGPNSLPVVSSEKAEAVRQYLSALGKLTP